MKKRKGIVIGASNDAIHSIRTAQKNGVYVIGLDGNPEAAGLSCADESRVVDISDIEKVNAAVSEIQPDFVIPVPIGRYLSTMGIINEAYGLKGANRQATISSTDKYLFHKALNKEGLRNIVSYLVNQNTQYDQIKEIPCPALFKPRYGSGSRDIFYANNPMELKAGLSSIAAKQEDFILEQAVQGTEYSIDGAVINGQLFITLLRKKIITPIPVRQPISSFAVAPDADNKKLFERIYRYIEKAVSALSYNNCLLNADLIVNEEQVFLIEMAPRPSGHYLHDVFVPAATGIDLAEEYIHFLMDEKYNFSPKTVKMLQIHFFDMENVQITKVPEREELLDNPKCHLTQWECNIKEGDVMGKISGGHSIMHRGFFIVEGNGEKDLMEQSEWILAQFKYNKMVSA